MNIMDRITKCIVDFQNTASVTPTAIYLGRAEMRELGKWAYDAGYKTDDGTAAAEGSSRPECMGLPAYEVNCENHMQCGYSVTNRGE